MGQNRNLGYRVGQPGLMAVGFILFSSKVKNVAPVKIMRKFYCHLGPSILEKLRFTGLKFLSIINEKLCKINLNDLNKAKAFRSGEEK